MIKLFASRKLLYLLRRLLLTWSDGLIRLRLIRVHLFCGVKINTAELNNNCKAKKVFWIWCVFDVYALLSLSFRYVCLDKISVSFARAKTSARPLQARLNLSCHALHLSMALGAPPASGGALWAQRSGSRDRGINQHGPSRVSLEASTVTRDSLTTTNGF